MSSELVLKLKGVRDLKKILETTVKDLGDTFNAATCQVMLSNPLDPNVTSICEYKNDFADESPSMASVTMPLVLHGRTFGALSLSRTSEVNQNEVNAMRVILGELGDIIRHAQINDIVQRDTFRDTFLVEIGNVMAYSLGIGDALFMVVNILGKVLQTSRCLFICTDDTQAGWKVYEFWQQDKVQSCQEFRWPTTDSPLIAQTLLSHSPLHVYEGQQNSYVSPVQEELQFIGVRSLLGVPLKSAEATHGCVILQQCDYRRAWTRNEIDMVQNVADKVADALVKLPAEKRAREPIMQLHQRTIDVPAAPDDGRDKIQNVRRALKGALGQQAIPSANRTGFVPPPPSPKPVQPPQVPKPVATPIVQPPSTPALPAANQPAAAAPQAQPGAIVQPVVSAGTSAAGAAALAQSNPTVSTNPTVSAVSGESSVAPHTVAQPPAGAAAGQAAGQAGAAPTISPVQSKAAQSKSLGSILGSATATPPGAPGSAGAADGARPGDPYADLDFGDFGGDDAAKQAAKPSGATYENPEQTWSKLDAIQPPAGQQLTRTDSTAANDAAASAAMQTATGDLPILASPSTTLSSAIAGAASSLSPSAAGAEAAAAAAISSPWGDLDSIDAPVGTVAPPPAAAAAATVVDGPGAAAPAAKNANPWGDLDAIGTPSGPAAEAPSGTVPGATAPGSGGPWGDLDSIQAPTGTPVRAGLGGVMLGKARASNAAKGPLKSSFRKAETPDTPPPAFVEGPIEPMDEAAAEAKLKSLVSSTASETSDYVFATTGLDMRMLGRIDGWVNQIEQKDKYVNGHARQVAEYAIAIARECGMSEAEVNTIRLAALVHDVGKLGAAASILQKPDEQLSDPELITMMKHPLDGAELLESFPDLQHLSPIVRGHHEEYDGNGYPQGLKGEEIPVPARIINVANSYFSLISNMRYGDGMSPLNAQNELVKGAGKQWDPKYVQALIQAILSKKVPASM